MSRLPGLRRVRAADALTNPNMRHSVCERCGKRCLLFFGECENIDKCALRHAKQQRRAALSSLQSVPLPEQSHGTR